MMAASRPFSFIGIDAASFAGAPPKMLEGNLEDLRLPNTVIVDELATERLAPDKAHPLRIGDQFEINDIEARVVGICDAERSFTGGPYVWTIYERALQYSPAQRKMLSGRDRRADRRCQCAPSGGGDSPGHRIACYVTGPLGGESVESRLVHHLVVCPQHRDSHFLRHHRGHRFHCRRGDRLSDLLCLCAG